MLRMRHVILKKLGDVVFNFHWLWAGKVMKFHFSQLQEAEPATFFLGNQLRFLIISITFFRLDTK
jgi:hypothetical protein